MDELTSVLDGPRAQNAFVVRSVLAPPWAIRIQDDAPLTIVAIVRGELWIRFDDGEVFRSYGSAEGFEGHFATAFVQAPDGRLYCGTQTGLAVFDGRAFRTWGEGEGFSGGQINALALGGLLQGDATLRRECGIWNGNLVE